MSMMIERFTEKKKYLTKEELFELNAFCSILPGPTSTQTITGIGYKLGRWPLAVLTLIVWMTPAVLCMTALVVCMAFWDKQAISTNFLKFIHPMAIAFIAFAGWRLATHVVDKWNSFVIFLLATLLSFLIKNPLVFPSIILLSAVIANFRHDDLPPKRFDLKLQWGNILLFVGIAIVVAILGGLTKNGSAQLHRPLVLFENFYRFGAIVFGGGQAMIPMMYEQFVLHRNYMSAQDLLVGVGIQQALPGPVFAIAAYAGGMAMQGLGLHYQLLGCLIGAVAIFLPGTLLLFFLYPIWNSLRTYPFIKRALAGINAAVVGIILSAAITLFQTIEINPVNGLAILLTFLTLQFTKVPPPFIVMGALILGWFL